MNLSRKWLSAFTDIKASSKEYAGSDDQYRFKSGDDRKPSEVIKNVVVGSLRPLSATPIPITSGSSGDVGQGEPVQIVTAPRMSGRRIWCR
jgi:hypothetical protein